MLGDVFDILFGCRHKRYSFPLTAKKGSSPQSQAGQVTGIYVVCLDCGKEFPYDWKEMKVVSGGAAAAEAASLSSREETGLVKVA
jgi:hypothetical protein